MLESRASYGWQGEAPKTPNGYVVYYKNKWGGWGMCGYLGVFKTKAEALKAYEREAEQKSFMVEPLIRPAMPERSSY